jgi:hypothetical protein
MRRGAILIAATAMGCGSGPKFPSPPQLVGVILHGAVVAPTKIDGSAWDPDFGSAPAGAARALIAAALEEPVPYLAVLDVFQKPMAIALARPDPAGTAEVETPWGRGTRDLPKIQDTFTPTWQARWDGVPLVEATRLRVSLTDKDVVNDDPIGDVVLNGTDLLAALKSARVAHVRVDDQSRQILFLDVEVIPEGTMPPLDGGAATR